MPPTRPIKTPAAYAPTFAVGYSDQNGDLAIVESATPLPVSLSSSDPITVLQQSSTAPAPLEGTTSASLVAGPYEPALVTPVILTLSGAWEGQVHVQRSTDEGITRHDLTAAGGPWGQFSANACEAVWCEHEDGAELYLDITVQSGTLEYRIAQ